MQVLRNMWKGEPGAYHCRIIMTDLLMGCILEFHLVAGGEELFSENGLLATVKAEETCESGALATLNGDASDALPRLSPSPPTPGYSPEFKLESPSLSPIQSSNPIFDTFTASSFPSDSLRTHSPPSQHDHGNVLLSQSPVTRGSPPSTFPFEHGSLQRPSSNGPSLYSADYQTQSLTPLAVTTSPDRTNPSLLHITIPANSSRFLDQVPSAGVHRSPTNHSTPKLSSLCLWAEGMSPCNLSVDSLRTSSLRPLSPVSLHINLSMPSMDDSHSLPAFHGFGGTVTFSAQWPSSAKCVTKVYAGKACISEETENLQLVASGSPTTDSCQLMGFLPTESSLTRCRWLEPGKLLIHHSDKSAISLTSEFSAPTQHRTRVHS